MKTTTKPELSWRDVKVPAMFMTGSRDYGANETEGPDWRRTAYENAPAGDKYFPHPAVIALQEIRLVRSISRPRGSPWAKQRCDLANTDAHRSPSALRTPPTADRGLECSLFGSMLTASIEADTSAYAAVD